MKILLSGQFFYEKNNQFEKITANLMEHCLLLEMKNGTNILKF